MSYAAIQRQRASPEYEIRLHRASTSYRFALTYSSYVRRPGLGLGAIVQIGQTIWYASCSGQALCIRPNHVYGLIGHHDSRRIYDHEEFIDGLTAVAVPVRDQFGNVRAPLALHAPTTRLTQTHADKHLPALHGAAVRMGELV